jgi:hypothetical protein
MIMGILFKKFIIGALLISQTTTAPTALVADSNSGSVSVESVIEQVANFSEDEVSIDSNQTNDNSTEVTDSTYANSDLTDLVMKATASTTEDGRRMVPYNLTHSGLQALEIKYPTGWGWGPESYYMWAANSVYRGGYGCAGFAYMLSDAVYGNAPAIKINGNGDVRQYDCVELFNNTHTAFVLEVNGDGTITVAEANVNGKVVWGCIIYHKQNHFRRKENEKVSRAADDFDHGVLSVRHCPECICRRQNRHQCHVLHG